MIIGNVIVHLIDTQERNVNILNNLKQNKMQGKGTEKQARISFILFLCILALLLATTLIGCSKEGFLQPNKNIEMSIDTRLPKDVNGYSVFNLYSTQTQNIHTISGSIRVNGKIPDEPRERVEWESSHYWTLKYGEDIGTIYRRTWRGLGWQIVDSIKVVNLKTSQVPTINSVCYNSADGSINTVIAPMWNMKGDTMTIIARIGNVIKVEKIILK
jgi:hypothetical protein